MEIRKDGRHTHPRNQYPNSLFRPQETAQTTASAVRSNLSKPPVPTAAEGCPLLDQPLSKADNKLSKLYKSLFKAYNYLYSLYNCLSFVRQRTVQAGVLLCLGRKSPLPTARAIRTGLAGLTGPRGKIRNNPRRSRTSREFREVLKVENPPLRTPSPGSFILLVRKGILVKKRRNPCNLAKGNKQGFKGWLQETNKLTPEDKLFDSWRQKFCLLESTFRNKQGSLCHQAISPFKGCKDPFPSLELPWKGRVTRNQEP